MVDAPRSGAANVAPTVVGRTSETAYLRLHGRNQATWNKRGGSAAERFDYLYSTQELAEWVEPLRELAAAAEQVFVMFNNNGRSTDAAGAPYAQAPINAAMMQELIGVHVG
jgi:uncharacterized protein YecE (DUF72 family)